jgi:hypothetical protein
MAKRYEEMCLSSAARPVSAKSVGDLRRLSQTIFVHQWPRLRPQYPPPPNNNKTTMTIKSTSMGPLRLGRGIATLPVKRAPLWIWIGWVMGRQRAVRQVVPKSWDRDHRRFGSCPVARRISTQRTNEEHRHRARRSSSRGDVQQLVNSNEVEP